MGTGSVCLEGRESCDCSRDKHFLTKDEELVKVAASKTANITSSRRGREGE